MKQLADVATQYLIEKEVVPKSDAAIYAYGFDYLFTLLYTYGSLLIFAACLGTVPETLLFFLAFLPLRSYAGGYHAPTRLRCYLCSVVMMLVFNVLLVITPVAFYGSIAFFEVVCAWLCLFLWAPIVHENRQVSQKDKARFRKYSFIICGVESLLLLIGQAIQSDNTFIFAFGLGIFSAVIAMPIAKLANKHRSYCKFCRKEELR